MKSGITPKSVAAGFLIVLVLYLGAFHGLEYLRHWKGPWELAFRADAQGTPEVLISQFALRLRDARLVFHGENMTNAPGTVSFDRVDRQPPLGRVIYHDLTFLPGVVTLDLFGHEIELLPRALIVDKQPFPWRSGQTIDLWPTNKPAQPPRPPRKKS
jgi:hypothetical protein